MNHIFLADFKELLGDIGAKIFPSLPALITQLLATFVMFFIVFKFFWKPIKEFIDKDSSLELLEDESKEYIYSSYQLTLNYLQENRLHNMQVD